MLSNSSKGKEVQRSSLRRIAQLAAVGLVLAGCSRDDAEGSSSAETAPPQACSVDPTTPDCAREVMLSTARNAAGFSDLDDDTIVEHAEALCQFAQGVAEDGITSNENMTLLVTTYAKEFGVAEAEVSMLTDSARSHLCPDQGLIFDQLRANDAPIPITLEATGGANLSISYSLPGGSQVPVSASQTWSQVIEMERPGAVAISVESPDASPVGCRVLNGTTVIVEVAPFDGQTSAECTAQASDIDLSRWSQPG